MTDTGIVTESTGFDYWSEVERGRTERAAEPDFGTPPSFAETTGTSPENRQAELDRIANDPSLSYADRIAAQDQLLQSGVHTPSPAASDLARRQQFLSEQAGGFRGPLTLGPAGMEEFGVRADLALSDTFEERKLKFMDYFPEGDFIFVPRIPESVTRVARGPTVLFRRNPEEDYAELDAHVLESYEWGDIADLAGAAPSMLLETGAAIATRGASSTRQLMAMFASGAAGELLREGVEELRGYQLESWETIGYRSLATAGISTVSGGTMDLMIRGPLNWARGSTILRLRPGATEAQRAAARLSIDPLLPTQIANNRIIQKIGNQLAGTVQSVNDWVVRQNEQAVTAMMRLRRSDLARLFSEDADNLRQLHQEASDQVVTGFRNREPSMSVGGTTLGQGVVEYDELASTIASKAYSDARKIATPEFDFVPAQSVADEVLAGVRSQRRPGTPTQIETGILDEFGDPIIREEADAPGTFRIGPDRPAQVDQIAREMLETDPSLPTTMAGTPNEADAVVQLRAWRSQLWDLKTPNPGEIFRQYHRDAQKLFSAVDGVLKRPTNADPNFLAAWRNANDLAHGRFDTLEKIMISEAGRTETPIRLAEKVIRPGSADDLRILNEAVLQGPEGAQRWSQFQRAVRGHFLEDSKVHRLNRILDSYDQDTLGMLFNQAEIRDLRRIADWVEEIDAMDLRGVALRQSEAGRQFEELIFRPESRQVAELVNTVKAFDPTDPRRLEIRSGIMETVYNRVVHTADNGQQFVHAPALRSTLEDLRKSRALELLTPEDIQVLNGLDEIMYFLPSPADLGASMEAASVAASARGLPRAIVQSLGGDTEAMGVIWRFTGEMIELMGIGKMFTSPKWQRLFLGAGNPKLDQITSLRIFGAILGETVQAQPPPSMADIMALVSGSAE